MARGGEYTSVAIMCCWEKTKVALCIGLGLALLAGCGRGGGGPAPARRVVVLGFDGVDPDLVEQWAADLPHVRELMEKGAFRRLQTTTPPASCTAWTSFATGLNPGGHGIFDFIYRDPKTYLPDRTGSTSHRAKYLWNLFQTERETFTTSMSGEPFWKTLDRSGQRSVVLRVPCVFPLAREEHGHLMAGFGAPDIRGTEGTFHYYSSAMTAQQAGDPSLGGKVVAISRAAEVRTYIEGPVNPLVESYQRLTVPLLLRRRGEDSLEVELQGHKQVLVVGRWGDWIRMSFKVTPFSSIDGMARFRLISAEPDIRLYLSPINYDPASPAIRVTEPFGYAKELYRAVGDYKTVGWNHETWGLNEERIDEQAFMEDVFETMRKTEEITFRELDTRPTELFVSVFVEPDRVSHMMYRLMDKNHPRYDPQLAAKYGDAIQQTYQRMDEIIGKMLSRLKPQDTLFVLSDHGFHSWRRGFNVNTWLIQEGYMTLKDKAGFTNRKFLLDVDWAHTRAYALGLGGIYINEKGREGRGIVDPGAEYDQLVHEIADKLKRVVDPGTGEHPVAEVYLASKTWSGSRVAEAQDLQLGLRPGYRVSSATPLGGAPQGLFEDNKKKWSGDHATSQTSITEGIFLSNRRINEQKVSILDLAPTILHLLGVEVPGSYDGKILTLKGEG